MCALRNNKRRHQFDEGQWCYAFGNSGLRFLGRTFDPCRSSSHLRVATNLSGLRRLLRPIHPPPISSSLRILIGESGVLNVSLSGPANGVPIGIDGIVPCPLFRPAVRYAPVTRIYHKPDRQKQSENVNHSNLDCQRVSTRRMWYLT